MNQVLVEILLIWIVGIPGVAIAGAAIMARRRERLTRHERLTARTVRALFNPAEPRGRRRLRLPIP